MSDSDEGNELENFLEKLDLRVSQVMVHNPLTVDADLSIEHAARAMAEGGCGSCLVTSHDKIVGILTERDIVRRVAAKGATTETKIRDVMTNPIVVSSPDTTVEEALEVMANKRIRRLPIVQDRRLVGIVSLSDIAKALSTKLGYENLLLNALSRKDNPPNGVYG